MKLFVIGNPIKHSKSPSIHNCWLKRHKLQVVYEKKLMKKEDLYSVVELVKNKEIIGFNVTLPFKESIIKHLDKLHPSAKESMAVNTVYLDNYPKVILLDRSETLYNKLTEMDERIFIADPFGKIILGYENDFIAKGLLKDIKKLLKFSKR